MNALLLMTSTFVAGADAPAAAPLAPAPAAVAGCGAGCDSGCAASEPCCSKSGLLDRLKGRMACHKHAKDCCASAPTCAPAAAPQCCAPAAPAAASCCDSCASPRPNLLDRCRAKMASKKHKGDCCAPACDTCGAAPAVTPVPTPTPSTLPPTPTPKPMNPKKVGNDGSAPLIVIPTPGANLTPTLPVTPVSGAKSNSPY
jgi:hypothetical protein